MSVLVVGAGCIACIIIIVKAFLALVGGNGNK